MLQGTRKRKARGWVPFGYKYLGPGNSLYLGEPTNESDKAAQKHDWKYHFLELEGKKPKWIYSNADDDFINEVSTDWGGRIGKAVFRMKRKLAERGWLEDYRISQYNKKHTSAVPKFWEPLTKKPGETQVHPTQSAMADNNHTGSGNNSGLKETPIDEVNPYEIYRGPPDYTFASLPYRFESHVDDTIAVWNRDIAFRMTSPYDPLNTVQLTDINAGTGSTRTINPTADNGDATIRSANWWSYYAGLYNYYHTVSCQYTIFIENYGEPIWVYLMNYNDDHPPPAASNLDMQLWPNCEYHYIGSQYYGLEDNGIRSVGFLAKTDDVAVLEEMDEDQIPSGSNQGELNTFVANNNIRSGMSGRWQKMGEYRPGQYRREIRLDSQVENWTGTSANPLLPEKLLIRIKPQSNMFEASSTRTGGDKLRFRIRVMLNYLVEFKELRYGLRYPVVNQPLTVSINESQTSRPA